MLGFYFYFFNFTCQLKLTLEKKTVEVKYNFSKAWFGTEAV